MIEHGMELVVPGVGEVVPLDDPLAVAHAIEAIRELKRDLYSAMSELTRALVHASQVAGSKTLHLEDISVTVKLGDRVVYDPEAIEAGLRNAGMPEERIREIVKETVSYVVNAAKAKQAQGANPAYAAVIDAHKRVEEKPPSVTLSRI